VTPSRVSRTRSGDRGEAVARLQVARKYLETAELADTDPGPATRSVVAGLFVADSDRVAALRAARRLLEAAAEAV
jgi:hypothetical protein